MAPLASVDTTVNNRTYDYTEKDAFDALYQELAKGVQSMKNGEVYTIEEAWEEIDKIQYMDKPKKYKIVLSKDALQDIKSTKTYILQTFMYREYAENFSKKLRSAIKALDPFAEGYEKTGYNIEGLEIYYKKLEQINKSIIKAITYPIFLMLALIALGIFVLFFFIMNDKEKQGQH